DSLSKLFGAQDIAIGDEKFDKHFTIKGNDENKIRLLFSNSVIRHLLTEIREVNLVLRQQEGYLGTQLPTGINELFFKADDVIIEIDKLKLLIQLFSETLDQLYSMGCAEKERPAINLR